MVRQFLVTAWLLVACLASTGCRTSNESFHDPGFDYRVFMQEVEYPDAVVESCVWEQASAVPPPSVRRADELDYWDMMLEEAIRLALSDSETIRQLGGRIVASPASTRTIYDPAIQETDPRIGPEAALSDFDAQLVTQLTLARDERKFNNIISGGGTGSRADDLGGFRAGISKQTAAGTAFSLDHVTGYDRNNVPLTFNRLNSVYDTEVQATLRQPLLRGAGIEFNRIAGPGATPGSYRGVLIARINSDITLADFEASVRNLLRDVERAYWELCFAYRDLDAKRAGRNKARKAWQQEKERAVEGGSKPKDEAFARSQFYLAQAAVENALSGTGAFPGVFGADRHLRSLLGLPASDGRLIRPSTSPLRVDIQFDWAESLDWSLVRRVELRRQRWKVKQRELELIAAKHFTRAQLDFVAYYKFRGLGDNLFGPGYIEDFGPSSSWGDLVQGEQQSWMVGLELKTPFGNRIGHAALRNAQLTHQRARAILKEQELQVTYELRDAFSNLDRAYAVTRSNWNRYDAAYKRLQGETKLNDEGATRLDLVLDAQRQSVEAEVAFHRAIVDHTLALTELNFARGTLLDSLQVYLSEGPWSAEAHASAAMQAARFRERCFPRVHMVPGPISAGAYQQRVIDETAEPEPISELRLHVENEPVSDARETPTPDGD